MDSYILQMKNITKDFSGVRALEDVSFNVKAGEIHGLVGENGAGKSTLMKVLGGVYKTGEYSGEIIVNGKTCNFKSIRDSEAEGISIIFQELAMVGCLSVSENLFIGHELTRGPTIDWDEEYLQTQNVFNRVGLDTSPDALVETLSVGKQQLVEISKSLLRNARLLILDEPTAALTDEETNKLFQILTGLKTEGITSVFISHKLGEVTSICDSITVLRDGAVIETMDCSDPKVTEQYIIKLMVNREMTQRFPEKTNAVRDEIGLEIRNWTVYNPEIIGRKAVDNASLFVRHGEIVGISGLMGSGRTELATSVFGKVYGANISGELFLDGQRVDLDSPYKALKAGVCYLTEDRKEKGLVTIFDVKTNISMANLDKLIGKGVLINENEETKIAEAYRESLRIRTPDVEQTLENLSGGNQQKVVLAKSLNTEPRVLIVDEPTRGIDVGAKYEIYTILNNIASRGTAVIMISSEMPELIGVCDRIYVMHESKIKGELSRAEATQERIMTLALSSNSGGSQ